MNTDRNHILIGDNRAQLAKLPARSVHCAVTSPPYWLLRSYLPGYHPDKAKEVGSEPTPEAFLATQVEVFRAVRRVLRDDGVLFVNLGDSYAHDTKWGGYTGGKHAKGLHGATFIGRNRTKTGLKSGDLCNMPHRLAAALQADGWFWRDTIIWHKPSPMPSSQNGVRWVRCRVKVATAPRGNRADSVARNGKPMSDHAGHDFAKSVFEPCPGCEKCLPNGGYILRRGRFRTTTSHEYVFLFSKSKNYHCDATACQEPVSGGAHSRGGGLNPKSIGARTSGSRANESFAAAAAGMTETRNPRSVWRIAPEPYKKAHFATFPSLLAKRCIEMATSPAGCCSACGAQFAPVVEQERVATRPGNDSKVGRVSDDPDSPYHDQKGLVVGNRDPQRHVARTTVTGYRPTCQCAAGDPVPCVVLDPYGGSGRTAQAAEAMGRNWILCELNADYVDLAMIHTPPRWTKPKVQRVPPPPAEAELPLFAILEAG